MYSVFLVDDEKWGLSALEASFEWKKFGFQVTGGSTQPEQALRMLAQKKPDVVFVDIRMPEMSGLELIDRARKLGADCEFLVVSGYADFQYAQEAIGKGVFEYLLKPVDMEKTDAILERLSARLRERRQSEDSRRLEDSQALFIQLQHQLRLAPEARVLAAVVTGCPEMQAELSRAVPETLREVTVFLPAPERTVFFFRQTEQNRKTFLSAVQAAVDAGGYVGVSRPFAAEDAVETALEEAASAAMARFLKLPPSVRFFFPSTKRYFQAYSGRIRATVSVDAAELPELLSAIRAEIAENRLGIDAVEYLVEDIRNVMLRRHDTVLLGPRSMGSRLRLTENYMDIDEFFAALQKNVAELLREKQTQTLPAANEHFKKMLAYVDAHYSEHLQLRELAEQFYMNVSYCSELFKKMTGKNFSEYLTTIRMEAAMRMLQSGMCSVGSVAAEVGYADDYYFRKVFKKYYGISPRSV